MTRLSNQVVTATLVALVAQAYPQCSVMYFDIFFLSISVGLLHDIPDVLEPNLSNLLFNCVFESIPGQRRQSANIIKRLLEAIGRHLTQ